MDEGYDEFRYSGGDLYDSEEGNEEGNEEEEEEEREYEEESAEELLNATEVGGESRSDENEFTEEVDQEGYDSPLLSSHSADRQLRVRAGGSSRKGGGGSNKVKTLFTL